MARRSRKARRRPKARPQGILELTDRGFGFVKTAEGEFFVPSSKVNGAFPGDLVEVSRLSSAAAQSSSRSSSRKPTARVVRVLMRAHQRLVGRYEVAEPFGVVVPENPAIPYDVFTLHKDNPQVSDGDMVEVELIEYPSAKTAATGRIVRVLGHAGDPFLEIDMIIAEHQFETRFGDQALEESRRCSLDVEGCLEAGYRDLRDRFIFTVDPVDARDFDDAISFERVGDTYHLGVHIADVSHYVAYDTAMDMEARRRATSVYLVDRVLPMLPEAISNSLCSLMPLEPRLTLSVDMVLREDASVESYEVFAGIIESKARLSYDQAQCLLDEADSSSWEAFRLCPIPQGSREVDDGGVAELQQKLSGLRSVTEKLFERRYRAGCMDFDRVEAKVRLDDEGSVLGVDYRKRTEATRIIEESMILANHIVAEWLSAQAMPCVYRIHDTPDSQALFSLYRVMQEFDFFKGVDKRSFCDGDPKTLQKVLAYPCDEQLHELISSLLLRSMKRAIYTTQDSLHYGLALDSYCHFTSPIRRYPDLLVHRMVKERLFGHTATFEAQKNALPWMAEHSSKMERSADEAERESQLVKLIEYLEKDIGTSFEGIVSSVSTFGVTIRLENTARGIISLEDLGDEYFSYDPQRYTLTGVETGRVYRLGQRIEATLTETSVRRRELIFKNPRLVSGSHDRHR